MHTEHLASHISTSYFSQGQSSSKSQVLQTDKPQSRLWMVCPRSRYVSWSSASDPKVSRAGAGDTGEGHVCARHLAAVTSGRWAGRTMTDV